MSRFDRDNAGADLSNVSVRLCGLRAKYWILYFIIVQLVLGVSNLIFVMVRVVKYKGTETSSGILNFLCVLLLLCSLWCQSKTFFTIMTVLFGIDSCTEFYLLFTRIVVALEVKTPYYFDNVILVVFSVIRVGFSSIYTSVFIRLSWCNGLGDEDDLEKVAIYDCIQEIGVYQCALCSENEKPEEHSEKID